MGGQVADGKSPAKAKKLARLGIGSKTAVFDFGKRFYLEQIVPNWKDPKYIRRYLDNEIYPSFGGKALDEVTVLQVHAEVYRKRDNGRIACAMQLRRVIKQLFDYALELQP